MSSLLPDYNNLWNQVMGFDPLDPLNQMYQYRSQNVAAQMSQQNMARQLQMDSGMMNQYSGLNAAEQLSHQGLENMRQMDFGQYNHMRQWYYPDLGNIDSGLAQQRWCDPKLAGSGLGDLLNFGVVLGAIPDETPAKPKPPSRLRRLCRWLKCKWNNRFQPRKEGLKTWKEIWT